ncbi:MULTISPECIES: DUF6444 domain-containing protein [unclassified Streptomyces]|uniref:DUF6444 domain-containing protein n=1 Tax=unclassified Streptomyces TaxID=2593676 RepID=UPI00338D954C
MVSANSSKPPSSDPLEKKAGRSQRERSKERRPGVQKGRVGRALEWRWWPSPTGSSGSTPWSAPAATTRWRNEVDAGSVPCRSSTSR